MRRLNYIALIVAIVAVSFAAILARLADISPVSIAFLRMAFSSLILLPVYLLKGAGKFEQRDVVRNVKGDVVLLIFSGLFLAMHFGFWIASLFFTTVVSSVVFVSLNPLIVALYFNFVRKEGIGRGFWVGLAISLAGMVILGRGDVRLGGENWKGDLLAIAGAVSIAGYFIVGSRLRKRLNLVAYVFPVYTFSAIFLFFASIVFRADILGLPLRAYIYCLLMALLCQVVGHSLLNWTLRTVKATVVTVSVLGEPVGSSFLAFLILDEVPTITTIIGSIVILSGIFVALRSSRGILRSDVVSSF